MHMTQYLQAFTWVFGFILLVKWKQAHNLFRIAAALVGKMSKLQTPPSGRGYLASL
jgi:hypothetical protein